jgi:wyosine [tRNA(Phe)-imidazoG37] synthetase (radical SAM superfamily)
MNVPAGSAAVRNSTHGGQAVSPTRAYVCWVDCLLCDEPVVDDDLEFCSRCYWTLRAEIEENWVRFTGYLESWAAFRAWELAHAAVGHRTAA